MHIMMEYFIGKNSEGTIKNGWYEYAPEFVNVLIAIDDSNRF